MSAWRPRHRLMVGIWGLVAALVAGLLLAVAALLWSQRNAELAEQAKQLSRVATGAEVGMNRTLLALDVLLATTEELLAGAEGRDAQARARAAAPLLAAIARQNLAVRSVMLLDESGAPLVTSSAAQAGQADLPPADFIAQALATAVPMLVVGNPVLNTRSAERVIHLARPLRLPGGQRLLAVAQVPVDGLVNVLLQGMPQSHLELTLERAQGALLIGLAPPQGLMERAHA